MKKTEGFVTVTCSPWGWEQSHLYYVAQVIRYIKHWMLFDKLKVLKFLRKKVKSEIVSYSVISDSATPWTVAHQAPVSMGFPRQEHWSGLPFPSPGNLPNQGSDLCLLHWQVDSFPLSHQGSPCLSISLSSVAQLCLTLCNPMDCSTPGFPVHHHLLELAQTHVHWVGDAIQPSYPLSSLSPPAFNLSQHQGLF